MQSRRATLIGAAFTLGLAGAALAQGTGAEGYFNVVNDTSDNTVVGFYTNDGSGWSENWLSVAIEPGQHTRAQFHANTGPCDQTLQIGWLGTDGGEVLDDPIDINICEASNVYLGDNEVTFD